MLTCDDDIGKDLTELFNYLTTGCKPSRKYRKILVAPKLMKRALLANIDREIAGQAEGSPGHIRIKANALEDADITEALYRASGAGVKVELILRDTCRLRPGLPGVSENVTVISIVGRFLEHGRVYYFRNGGPDGGGEEFFIGSADLMTRNLESRVELLAPVEDEALRDELRGILDMQLADRHNVWDMLPDGRYVARRPSGGAGEAAGGCQHALIAAADRRHFEANRLRKRKPRVLSRRAPR